MAEPLGDSSAENRSPTRSIPSESPISGSIPRHASITRLASPVPSSWESYSQSTVRTSSPTGTRGDFPSVGGSSLPRPGVSALASGLQGYSTDSVRQASPARCTAFPSVYDPSSQQPASRSACGSFDTRPGRDLFPEPSTPPRVENPEIVKRHLVQPESYTEPSRGHSTFPEQNGNNDPDEFSSLKLQGGDITRQVYKWAQDAETGTADWRNRRRSFELSRPPPDDDTLNINSIRVPGGFRRDYLRRAAGSPAPNGIRSAHHGDHPPPLFTNNFLEFLTLFGHFAGEELEEDDEVLGPDEYFTSEPWPEEPLEEPEGERESLLHGRRERRPRRHKVRAVRPTNSAFGAILLLLKSFVGTGVLFLPKAFLNGGMVFSSIVLTAISVLSYYCFVLLVRTRERYEGSFGDIGGILYGKYMRDIILASIVLSQIGFVSAYIVFVSENLQAFVLAVSNCRHFVDIKYLILVQLIVFLPLSLIRDIGKLGFTALVADFFILLGLIYLYGYDIKAIVANKGMADVQPFNPVSWTLLIGTAIFTYEGVGLVIPIQESMKRPQQFVPVLALVMVLITVVFLSMGILGYAAFGSTTETVIILNLPQDDKFVNSIQLFYSLAILLSTPLQLFPAIRILENGLFTRSGKYNPGIKWKKNGFRFMLVFFCALVAWIGAADLDKFVSIVGSFACVPLVYVYPVGFSPRIL